MHKVVENRKVRWDEQAAVRAYSSGEWVRAALPEFLQRECESDPDRPLIIDGDVTLTPRLLSDQARRLAGELSRRYPRGSVVSFMLPNWHEAAVIYMAATLAGLVVNPILPSLRGHELRFMLADVASRMIFIPAVFRQFDYRQMLRDVVERLETPPDVVVLRGDAEDFTAYSALFEGPALTHQPAIDAEAVRMIMYTSGTTGRPKGVMHTHNSIHALIKQIGQYWRIDSTSRFLVPSPISHIGGSIYAFETPLILGASAVLMEQWEPVNGVSTLLDQRCTHFAGATPFLAQTLSEARRVQTHLPDLRVFICGGASVPPSLIRDAKQYFSHASVSRVYGSTEVPVTTVGALLPGEEGYAATTDGRAGIAEIKLVDGAVWARGPQMLAGYINTDDEIGAFDSDGYYATGDLGEWVDDRYLVISGRGKDLIIRSGENIAPKEIEDLLLLYPDIDEVAIVGVPNARTGERAVAVVVLHASAELELPSLIEFLVAHDVAKFKIPEQLEIWQALPKNDAGKVLKHTIRDRLLASTVSEETSQ